MSNIRIVVLGSGGSGGVPYAGNFWGICNPNNDKNHRTRPSIYIQKGNTKIVIDTGPEFREQINRTGISGTLDAVLYTHAHNDHVMGLDDLRSFSFRAERRPVDVYATKDTLSAVTSMFGYAFSELHPQYPPIVRANKLPDRLIIGDLVIDSFEQIHGDIKTTGYRIGDFAYSTDVNILPDTSLEKLRGIKTWIVGAFSNEEDSFNHAGLAKIRAWVAEIKPEMTYLTHLNAYSDYDDLCARLPDHIRPAYDGLELIA